MNKPVIAIMSQPASGSYKQYGFNSMIPASYVYWITQIGAKVVPLPYHISKTQIKQLLSRVNGLVLPGGGQSVFNYNNFKFYKKRVNFVLNQAQKQNQQGINFPIWGTCMGFEQQLNWASNYTIRPTKVNDYRTDRTIHWNEQTLPLSPFSQFLDDEDLSNLEKFRLSYFNHVYSITKDTYQKNKQLQKVIYVIGDTYNKDGINFQSVVYGKQYPFFGTQFHPEKIQFERVKATVGMNTSNNAITAAKKFAVMQVHQARKNQNKFHRRSHLRKLEIENYDLIDAESVSYESIYFFSKSPRHFAEIQQTTPECKYID